MYSEFLVSHSGDDALQHASGWIDLQRKGAGGAATENLSMPCNEFEFHALI
jgi:hypothetical protein